MEVVAVGKKGRDWLLRYDPVIRAEFTDMPDSPATADIGPISRTVIDDFRGERFDEVHLIYNRLRQYAAPAPHRATDFARCPG